MDRIDQQIIEKLKENSRASYKEISKEVKISDVAVHKRIKKLQKNLIKKFTIIVDQKKTDRQTTALIMVRCDTGTAPEIAAQISAIPDVSEVYTTVGEFDIIAKIRTANMESLKELVEQKLRMIRGIHNITSSIVFDAYKEDMSMGI